MPRYIDPKWLEYATDEELFGLESWLANTKPSRTKSGQQVYGVVKSLITGEVERRWQRQPAKVAKKKNRQGAETPRRSSNKSAR